MKYGVLFYVLEHVFGVQRLRCGMLLSAGDPSANLGITLRLLLTCDTDGVVSICLLEGCLKVAMSY